MDIMIELAPMGSLCAEGLPSPWTAVAKDPEAALMKAVFSGSMGCKEVFEEGDAGELLRGSSDSTPVGSACNQYFSGGWPAAALRSSDSSNSTTLPSLVVDPSWVSSTAQSAEACSPGTAARTVHRSRARRGGVHCSTEPLAAAAGGQQRRAPAAAAPAVAAAADMQGAAPPSKRPRRTPAVPRWRQPADAAMARAASPAPPPAPVAMPSAPVAPSMITLTSTALGGPGSSLSGVLTPFEGVVKGYKARSTSLAELNAMLKRSLKAA